VAVHRGRFDLVVELATAAAVRALEPEFATLARVGPRGVVVTAAGDDGTHEVVSRCFAPAVGIDEDPVTGSAHCTLACLWAPRLGRDRFLARQESRRGGTVRVELAGDRVRLADPTITVLRGTLAVEL
jgi:predicted PhzF superfamily epimerase YddE/YHI9